MVDRILATLGALDAWPLYGFVAVLAFGESAGLLGLVVPGETVILLGAALAAQGHARIEILAPLVVLAVVSGDIAGYLWGRRLGPQIRTGRLGNRLGPARWQMVEDAMARRGVFAVILGRWVGIARALLPATAGATGMPSRRFIPAAILGGAVWAVVITTLGFAAGSAWEDIGTSLKRGGLIAGTAALTLILARRLRSAVGSRGGHEGQRWWLRRRW